MSILLLASRMDSASLNIYSELMDTEGWGEEVNMDHGMVSRHHSGLAEALLIEDLHIWADGIDTEHQSKTGREVDEVLVLSRHVSASETPAMTLHAIGVPGETPHGEIARSGGITGKVVPPSTMFGDLFRTMSRISIEKGLESDYDITLETTHHGPVLQKPTLYVEIGSTEDRWSDRIAARVWAETISECIGLDGGNPKSWQGSGDVMVGFGGGHYAPRHKAIIAQSDVWVGHLIANYAIPFDKMVGEEDPEEVWKHSVSVAIASTQEAFPGGRVFAHLDRKSFKGWQRSAMIEFLHELGVPVMRGKQILPP